MREAVPLSSRRKPGTKDVVEIRKRNRVLLKSLLIVCVGINAVLDCSSVHAVSPHPYFNLQQVNVTGNRRLSKEEVREASEMEKGLNLLTVDLNAIAERLRRHPWIRSAAVYRRFPGEIIIEIDERNSESDPCGRETLLSR